MPDPKKKVPFRLNEHSSLQPIYGSTEYAGSVSGFPAWYGWGAYVDRSDIPQDINEFLAFRERWIAEQMRKMYEAYSPSVGGVDAHIGANSEMFSDYGYNADPNLSAPDAMVTQLRQYMDRLGADERERREKGGIWRMFNPPQEGTPRRYW